MKQISKNENGYKIFDCESKVVILWGDWEFVAYHMRKNPDIYVLDASVKDE